MALFIGEKKITSTPLQMAQYLSLSANTNDRQLVAELDYIHTHINFAPSQIRLINTLSELKHTEINTPSVNNIRTFSLGFSVV